jgi:hypothetical protein
MALAVGASALAVAIPAGLAASPAGNQVPLVVPPSGAVAIQAVKLRVTGPGAGKVAVPSRLELRGANLPRDATAMIALRTSRSNAATTITFLAVTVSRSTKASAVPLPAIGLADGSLGTYALATAGTRKADTIWQASLSFTPAAGCAGCRVHASAIGLVDTGKTPPARGAAFAKALEKLLDSPDAWDPLVKPDVLDKGSSLRLYDAAHAPGRPVSPALASQAPVRPAAPARPGHLRARRRLRGVRRDVGVHRRGAPLRRLRLHVQGCEGNDDPLRRLELPQDDDLLRPHLRSYARRAALEDHEQEQQRPPVTRTIDFRKTRVIFTDSATVNGFTGTAIHKLYLVPGAFPGMQAIVDSTGVWSSDLGGGITVPVSVTRLPAGKSC